MMGNALGECVLWCARGGRVWWTDILGATLYARHLESGDTRSWPMPERLASFALTDDADRLLLGLASRLASFELASGAITCLMPVEPELATRVNDGRCDRAGNFVFGTMHDEDDKRALGGFYRLNADGLRLERLALPGVAIANSIGFSPDGTRMYYCDSLERAIRCCDYPSLGNQRIFVRTEGQGEPDGSHVDADGHLWNAQWGAARVVRYAPDGSIERVVPTPAAQPTCVTLGGTELDVLLCTSATVGLPDPAPHDGALLGLRMAGVRGLEESRFRFGPALPGMTDVLTGEPA